MPTVSSIRESVANIAPQYDIKKVWLFGSFANGTETENSDVDLLIEFTQPAVSIFKLAAVKLKMQEIIGREVDIIHSPLPENALIEIEKEVLLYEQ